MTKDGGIHHVDLCLTLTANVPGSVIKLFQCAPDNPMQVCTGFVFVLICEVLFPTDLRLTNSSYSETCLDRPLKNRQNKDLKDLGAFCNTFDLH